MAMEEQMRVEVMERMRKVESLVVLIVLGFVCFFLLRCFLMKKRLHKERVALEQKLERDKNR